MGGCRCSFRNCTSATKTSENLHFFHYPVKNKERCTQWIENARKPQFNHLPEDQLRNKVVCQNHFEDRCFINVYKKRLVHNAVPTVDSSQAGDDGVEIMNSSSSQHHEDKNNYEEHISINIIPTNDDCTNFTLDTGAATEVVDSAGVETYIFTNDSVVPLPRKKSVPGKMPEYSVRSVFIKEEPREYFSSCDSGARKAAAAPSAAAVSPDPPVFMETEYIEQDDEEMESLHRTELLERRKVLKKVKRVGTLRKRVITKGQILQYLEKQVSPALLTALNIDLYGKQMEFTEKEADFLVNFYETVSPEAYMNLRENGWEFLPNVEIVETLLTVRKDKQ